MRLTMRERKTVTKVFVDRYKRTRKKEKGIVLDEFVEMTGYHRTYASEVLRGAKKVGGASSGGKRSRRKRPVFYDELVAKVLTRIWVILDCICGKRLVAALPEIVPILERFGEIRLSAKTREKLLRISASTIDRLLTGVRQEFASRGRSRTKPGTLLKHQIPIRTFADWDEQRPGFVEIDLVGHEGGVSRGDFLHTLDVTDVFTGWTETQAVRNKAQVWVFGALKDIRTRLPFQLLGIDSDNGSEFINDQLLRYCREEKITFTRSRSTRKNDNCYVEQKNYSIVRRAVGYYRYDTEQQLELLNQLYQTLRLYTNYFQPVMKLREKTRVGSRVSKRYDQPKTPYRRLLDSSSLTSPVKRPLRAQYASLNPAALKRQITRLQQQLMKLAARNSSAAPQRARKAA
jgi:hypothetical protein